MDVYSCIRELNQEYLYSSYCRKVPVLNGWIIIARVFILSLKYAHVKDKNVWREYLNYFVNMSNYVLFYKMDASREYLYSTNNNIVNEFAYSNES